MDDSTKKTGGTVVQLYTSNAGGRDSPDDARQIQGTLLTFADKTYYAGTGRFKEEVQLGTRFCCCRRQGRLEKVGGRQGCRVRAANRRPLSAASRAWVFG
jgi:hypothetical protein